jgi:hypothetical protein
MPKILVIADGNSERSRIRTDEFVNATFAADDRIYLTRDAPDEADIANHILGELKNKSKELKNTDQNVHIVFVGHAGRPDDEDFQEGVDKHKKTCWWFEDGSFLDMNSVCEAIVDGVGDFPLNVFVWIVGCATANLDLYFTSYTSTVSFASLTLYEIHICLCTCSNFPNICRLKGSKNFHTCVVLRA